jgi:hypothetical protein
MSDQPIASDSQAQASDVFFGEALHRIRRVSIVLGVSSAAIVWAVFGAGIGVGFVIGCVVSYINFVWLERAINAVANRVTQSEQTTSGKGIVIRFLMRYFFIAIACFVILICFKSSVYGLLGGLFLTVASILCEAAYEVTVALRRGI